jgi:hypothetical protein
VLRHFGHVFQEKKKKWEPPAPPPRVGKKQRKRDAQSGLGSKLPTVTPSAKCKLRLLKLERIKDYLLMEHEFVQNQEQLKPQDERNEEDRSKVCCNAWPGEGWGITAAAGANNCTQAPPPVCLPSASPISIGRVRLRPGCVAPQQRGGTV